MGFGAGQLHAGNEIPTNLTKIYHHILPSIPVVAIRIGLQAISQLASHHLFECRILLIR